MSVRESVLPKYGGRMNGTQDSWLPSVQTGVASRHRALCATILRVHLGQRAFLRGVDLVTRRSSRPTDLPFHDQCQVGGLLGPHQDLAGVVQWALKGEICAVRQQDRLSLLCTET